MSSEPDRDRLVRGLYEELVRLTGEDRRRRMAEIRKEDDRLAALLGDLLMADGVTDALVDGRDEGPLGSTAEEPAWSAPGRKIGRWRLLEPLGRGGMGMVFAAERADGQFDQRAALKLIPRALDLPAMRRRFLLERQILARLEHAAIARLLDGGVTEDGTPYLVMERVDGVKITHHCDERRLGIAERIEVFLQVCEAVAYAHRNLVVHRDLKPDHCVITAAGVKLLDFGVAKVLDEEDEAGFARTEVRALTPEYAAPEQVRREPVSTVTDVYSLGLILYELLCGSSAQEFPTRTPAGIEHVVCEREPPRPSVRVVDDIEAADARSTTPERLRRRLAGDLDAVVATALRKEPARRYPSVEALAADLRRVQEGLPVHAREPSWRDRAVKFVRRHTWGVASAVVVVVALVAGTSIALWQARVASGERDRARVEARKAEEVVELMAGLFDVANPLHPQPVRADELSARELVDRAAARLEIELSEQPAVQAELMSVLGEVYENLSLHDEAEALIEGALERRRELDGPEHPRVAAALVHLGLLRHEQGEYSEAARIHREALGIRRSDASVGPLEVAESEHHLGLALASLQSDPEEAEQLLRRALATRREQAPGSLDVASTANTLGNFLTDQGRDEEAEALLRETLEIRRRRIGDDHPSTAVSLDNLAQVLRDAGRYADAEPLLREANGVLERHLGRDHLHLAIGLDNLADAVEKQGRPEEAEEIYASALEVLAAPDLVDHPFAGVVRSKWGGALAAIGRTEEGIAAMGEGYETVRAAFGDEHALTELARERLESHPGSGLDAPSPGDS